MQPQQAILRFSEAERVIGDRLLKIAVEIDRVEGYSEPHSISIARISGTIGERMGLHGTDLTALKFAALAHDLGERVMKRNYLLRPIALSWDETLDLWRHPILGEQAAGELRLSRQTQLLIRWHHEWWNGLGYPDRLAGEFIPAGARIIRVVDSYCSLISTRPYRQRYEALEAEETIADLAGIEFDPNVVRLLLSLLAEERRDYGDEFQRSESEIETQIVLTPEGLQTAFVETETDPELEILTTEIIDEVETVDRLEALAIIDPELPASENSAPHAQKVLPEPLAMNSDSDNKSDP